MEKIIIYKQKGKPVGKDGSCVWISKEVSDKIDAICDETGIAKQRITDFLLRKALECVELAESEI